MQRYRFNTKDKDQMFCGKCGASLGIDFRDFYKPKFDGYGISVSLLSERELCPGQEGVCVWGGEGGVRVCVSEGGIG